MSEDSQQDIQAIFKEVRAAQLEPSPFLKTRVLAHLHESQRERKQLLLWKSLFAGSFAIAIFLGVYTVSLLNRLDQDGVAMQAYVIHVDFQSQDLTRVANAEVILPPGVHFVSSEDDIKAKRQLKLPIEVKALGRGKLPFVVAADSQGEKKITVRLLDEKDQLVREQTLNFKFAKQDGGIAL